MSPLVKIFAFILISVLMGQSYMIYDLKKSMEEQSKITHELVKNNEKKDMVIVKHDPDNKPTSTIQNKTDISPKSAPIKATPDRQTQAIHYGNWEPFKELHQMEREFEKVFGRMHSHFANDPFFKGTYALFPQQPLIDVSSNLNEYIIKIEIPGVEYNNIETKVENNILTIKAEMSEMKESNSTTFISKERHYNRFQRSISLAYDADSSKMQSEYKDGILIITIPKK